jgi:hypothetical protein
MKIYRYDNQPINNLFAWSWHRKNPFLYKRDAFFVYERTPN